MLVGDNVGRSGDSQWVPKMHMAQLTNGSATYNIYMTNKITVDLQIKTSGSNKNCS